MGNLQSDHRLKWPFWKVSKSRDEDAQEAVKVKTSLDEVLQILEVFEVEVGVVEIEGIVMTMEDSSLGPETTRILKKCVRNPDLDPDPEVKNGIVEVEVKVEKVI